MKGIYSTMQIKKRVAIMVIYLFILGTAYSQVPSSQCCPKTSPFEGYLFAYFEGKGDKMQQEQLRFAVSPDAINWYALNNNRPILSSEEISQTGGIRDPHILRGEESSSFYMVATDMFTMKNGWDSNPGIILMKSVDLTEWSHSIIDIAKLCPKKFGNVKWVWAPQTIYDAKAKKYLVYFTIRFKDKPGLDFYCAYANKDFTGFEKEPKLMFSPKYGGIDGDIVYKDGVYHFFYKGNIKDENGKEAMNGIRQATSRSLQGPWKELPEFLDAYCHTSVAVEGSGIFKLNDSEEYLLMYDLYKSGRYEFQRSRDLLKFTSKPESFTKDFHPRHGSVISITREEARRLQEKWGGVPAPLLRPVDASDCYRFTAKGNPVITHLYTADPSAWVQGDTLWLHVGHDFAGGQARYKMTGWLVFSTTDMKYFTEYPVSLKLSDFKWAAKGDAYAGQMVGRNGKYYWYISTNGHGIGVATSDNPQGPYKDALGKPLVTYKDCFDSTHSWACIDPAVFIDDDGTAWLFWGNKECYYVKLKDDMITLDGDIKRINFPGFTNMKGNTT